MKIVNRGETFNNGKKVAESEYVNPIAAERLAKDVAVLAAIVAGLAAGLGSSVGHDQAAEIRDRWAD